jgi:hypothetical protein
MLKDEDTVSLTSFHFLHCLYDCTGRGEPCVYYRSDLMDLASECLCSLSHFSPTLELDFWPDSCRIPRLSVCLSVTSTQQTASEGSALPYTCFVSHSRLVPFVDDGPEWGDFQKQYNFY